MKYATKAALKLMNSIPEEKNNDVDFDDMKK